MNGSYDDINAEEAIIPFAEVEATINKLVHAGSDPLTDVPRVGRNRFEKSRIERHYNAASPEDRYN